MTKRTDPKPRGIHTPPINPKTGKTVTGSAREKWERSIAGQIAKRRGGVVKKAVEKQRGRFSGVQSQESEDTDTGGS